MAVDAVRFALSLLRLALWLPDRSDSAPPMQHAAAAAAGAAEVALGRNLGALRAAAPSRRTRARSG